MRKVVICLIASIVFCFISCSTDDHSDTKVVAPADYIFERNGINTVSYPGQKTRILMSNELVNALLDFDNHTALSVNEMYANMDSNGNDVSPFENEELNISTKSVKSKVAASNDLFSTNNTEGLQIKEQISTWIDAQMTEVANNQNVLAEAGVAGQIADGTTTRYVNSQGLEYNQAIHKSLIGALILDQIVNNYLSQTVLDNGDNIEYNDNEITEEAQSYTTMEHKWDEAYGYLFGADDSQDPLESLGSGDAFLNKYLGKVSSDSDFATYGSEVFDAFKLGRAAIVANDYLLRDQQAEILKELLSKTIAIRAIHYLQKSKLQLDSNLGGAFHSLSEGYGFVYSLRFTRASYGNDALFSRVEVDELLATLLGDGQDGFWDISVETLDQVSEDIAAKFDFTVAQAAQ